MAAGVASRSPTGTKSVIRWARGYSQLLILLIPLVLVCVPVWPGHMNADTLNELSEVISGNLTDYHAPILIGIWHLFWGVGVGPGWVLVAQVSCFVLGAYLLMRTVFARFGAAIAASVITLLPQAYGQLGLIGRDTWYTSLLLLSVGALAWGFARNTEGTRRRRAVAIVISLGAGWLALAARQNAVTSVVVIFGATIVLTQMTRWRSRARNLGGRVKRLAIVVIGAIALTLGFYASQSILEDIVGVQRVHPEQYIYDYDLAGMSVRENRDLFPHSILPPNRLDALKQYFGVDNIVPAVVAGPLPHQMLDARKVAELRRAEIKAVKDAPLTWFHLHWDEYLDQVAVTSEAQVIMHPGIDGNPFGLRIKLPGLDSTARGYVELFDRTNVPVPTGGIVFAPWIYLLIAIVGTLALRWWREPRWLLVGTLALSSLTYQVGVFLSMGVGYRLELPSVVTGLVVLIMGGRMLLGRRREAWAS